MGLVPTTLVPPRSTQILIHRPGWRPSRRKSLSRLTTICAPAGSGKTTAALYWYSQLTASGRPGLWLAARPGIRDLSSFLLALKAAVYPGGT